MCLSHVCALRSVCAPRLCACVCRICVVVCALVCAAYVFAALRAAQLRASRNAHGAVSSGADCAVLCSPRSCALPLSALPVCIARVCAAHMCNAVGCMSRAQKYFGCACVCTALVIVHFVAPPVLRLRLCALRSCAFIAMRLYACACLHLCVPPLWQVLTCVHCSCVRCACAPSAGSRALLSFCWWRVTFECTLLLSVDGACVCTTRVSAALVRVACVFASCATRGVLCTFG